MSKSAKQRSPMPKVAKRSRNAMIAVQCQSVSSADFGYPGGGIIRTEGRQRCADGFVLRLRVGVIEADEFVD